jgi:acyl dehydratase
VNSTEGRRRFTCAELGTMVGEELGVTPWVTITQEMITKFGESTNDLDWIHLDPERAARETPYGGSIAFGFWTLSMLTYFSHQIGMWPTDIDYALNYGLDKVRWVAPAPVGARIRNRCKLLSFKTRAADQFMIRTLNEVELEGSERPAVVAEWLGVFVRKAAEAGEAEREGSARPGLEG